MPLLTLVSHHPLIRDIQWLTEIQKYAPALQLTNHKSVPSICLARLRLSMAIRYSRRNSRKSGFVCGSKHALLRAAGIIQARPAGRATSLVHLFNPRCIDQGNYSSRARENHLGTQLYSRRRSNANSASAVPSSCPVTPMSMRRAFPTGSPLIRDTRSKERMRSWRRLAVGIQPQSTSVLEVPYAN